MLLATLTNTERLHIDVQRVLVAAREDVPREDRASLRPELEAVLAALVAAMQERARRTVRLGQPLAPLEDETAAAIRSSLDALEAKEAQWFAGARDAAAAANIASVTGALRDMGDRLLAPPLAFQSERPRPFHDVIPAGLSKARAKEHSVKVAVAATIAYVACLTSQRSDLGVIVWTAILAGLPTYGATLRRSFLRFVGVVLGGALTIAVIIAVSPNYDSLGGYAVTFFCVLFVCAYLGMSGPRLAYAGLQAALTFVIMYYGLSPSTNVDEPLWRLWGLLVGLVIVSVVFLVVMPGYAVNAIPPRLLRMLELALDLLRPGAAWNRQQVRDINADAIRQLTELLRIADDARLEGTRSHVHPDRLIEAAGTLLRIIDRLCVHAVARLSTPPRAGAPVLEADITALAAGLREHIERWVDAVEHRVPPAPARSDLGALRAALHQHLVLAELASWPERERTELLAEIESYRRTAELVLELDEQLGLIPG
jgi:uncharacterized membrane protein YccC